MKETMHTPTPWKFHTFTGKPHVNIRSESVGGSLHVAYIEGRSAEENAANSDFICHCVNLHAELVGALEDMEQRWELVAPLFNGKEFNTVRADTSKEICRALLKRARGEA